MSNSSNDASPHTPPHLWVKSSRPTNVQRGASKGVTMSESEISSFQTPPPRSAHTSSIDTADPPTQIHDVSSSSAATKSHFSHSQPESTTAPPDPSRSSDEKASSRVSRPHRTALVNDSIPTLKDVLGQLQQDTTEIEKSFESVCTALGEQIKQVRERRSLRSTTGILLG